MKGQRGIGFLGIFFICVVIVLGSIGAMKIVPAYLEYYSIKDAINKVLAAGPNSVLDIKRSFEKQIEINNIQAISSTDLEIVKDGSEFTISFAYPVKIHMFNNVFVCIDFAGTTAAGGVAPEAPK